MTIVPITSSGAGITVTATQSAGAINATNVTAGGAGYTPGATVTFSVSGTGGGSGAILTGTIGSNGSLATGTSTLTITAAGSAYSGTITVGAPQLSPQGGIALVTATGAVQNTAGVDISTVTNPLFAKNVTWAIELVSMTAGKSIAVSLECSLNAFSASVFVDHKEFLGQQGQGGTSFVAGAYNPTTDKRSTVVRQQLPWAAEIYFGIANGLARINVVGIDSSAQAAINSWFEIG